MSRITTVTLAGLLAGLIGCSSSNSGPAAEATSSENILREVGGLISSYTGEFKKAPSKVADVARYEVGYPLGYQAIKAGDVVVIWGAPIRIEEGGGAATGGTDVVAYEKKAPAEGGQVLLQNGQVKEMTAAEFSAAPKAAGKK